MKQKYLFFILTALILSLLIGCQQSGKATERLNYAQQQEYIQQQAYYETEEYSTQYQTQQDATDYYSQQNNALANQNDYSNLIISESPTEFFYFGSETIEIENKSKIIKVKVYSDYKKTKLNYTIKKYFPLNGRKCSKMEIIYEPYEVKDEYGNIFCVHKTDFYENCDDEKIFLKTVLKVYNGPCSKINYLFYVEEVDPNGKTKKLEETIKEEDGSTTFNKYYPNGNKSTSTKTEPDGTKTTTTYNKRGGITKIEKINTDGSKTVTEYTYTEEGKIIKTKITKYEKDDSKKEFEVIFDENGNKIKEKLTKYDKEGKKIEESVKDDHGRTKTKFNSDGTTTTYFYDENNDLLRIVIKKEVTNPDGSKTVIKKVYDKNGTCIEMHKDVFDKNEKNIRWNYFDSNSKEVKNEPSISV